MPVTTSSFYGYTGGGASPGGGTGFGVDSGTATLDFGSAPGSTEASVTVTGQTDITATSAITVTLNAQASGTADHSVDEHWREDISVSVGSVVVGVGFTIYGVCNTGRTTGTYTVSWIWA